MADSFFGFATDLEKDALDDGLASEDDEEDYDALNDETFGDGGLEGDWEQDHEKLAEITELSRHQGVINENGDLSAKIAAFLLDDEPKSNEAVEMVSKPRTPRPPPGFNHVSNNNQLSSEVKLPLPAFKNVCTVEEIERNLIKPPVTSLRLEDLERNLIAKPNPQLVNLRHAPAFFAIAARHPLLNTTIPKLQPISPFQLQNFPHPFTIQPPGLRVAAPPPAAMLRLGALNRNLIRPPPLPPSLAQPLGDPYAGLMSNKEKNWLAQIQLTQLLTNNPFQDDYYYAMYQHRQSGTHGRKVGLKMSANRDTPTLTKPIYTPLQFENSLGKLQIGSVMAPRKIIDTDVVESVDCHNTSSTSSRKIIKQILLEIEHMFTLLLTAEEALSPHSSSSSDINPTELFSKIVNFLLKDDKLKTVLNIRKGKTLVLRVLPHTEVSGPLAHRLITILPSVVKRDMDQSFLRALPAIRHFLATADLSLLVTLSPHLHHHLSDLLANKLGVSVLANMLERAEYLFSSPETPPPSASLQSDWLSFVVALVEACPSEAIERPVVGISGPVLARHLTRCPPPLHNSQNVAILQRAIANNIS